MKLAGAAVTGFLNKPNPAAIAVLVYGPDVGLVRERADHLAKTVCADLNDPFRVARLTGAQLSEDAALLADEAAAIAMIGGRRVVRVEDIGDRQAAVFKAFLANPIGDALIVVAAGDLPKRSTLRSLFEEAANAAALPCYADDADALERLVRAMLTEAKLKIGDDQLDHLVSRLGGDRALSRREIEKLITYKGRDTGPVSDADIDAVVGDTAASGIDDVVQATASGNFAELDHALGRAFSEGDSPVAILRMTQQHFHRLQHAVAAGGDPRGQAKRLGVFYKREAAFVAQTQRWPLPRIAQALDLLTAAELDCKSTGAPDEAICRHALLRIATAARGSAGNRR